MEWVFPLIPPYLGKNKKLSFLRKWNEWVFPFTKLSNKGINFLLLKLLNKEIKDIFLKYFLHSIHFYPIPSFQTRL